MTANIIQHEPHKDTLGIFRDYGMDCIAQPDLSQATRHNWSPSAMLGVVATLIFHLQLPFPLHYWAQFLYLLRDL